MTHYLSETQRAAIQRRITESETLIGVSSEDLKGYSKFPEIVAARHWVWRKLHGEDGLSLSAIARAFNKHHTTILSAVRQAQ